MSHIPFGKRQGGDVSLYAHWIQVMSDAREEKDDLMLESGSAVGSARTCLLDSKKRFTVSVDWRKCLGGLDYIYVMPDPDPKQKCLNLVSPTELNPKLEKLREMARSEPGLSRKLLSLGENIEPLKMDVQRRVRICDHLLRSIGVEDKVVLAPAVTCVQVWSPEEYPGKLGVDRDEFADAYKLMDIMAREW